MLYENQGDKEDSELNQEQIVTVDISGNLRSWAISYAQCSASKVKCLQEIALYFAPQSFAIDSRSNTIAFASIRLRILKSEPLVKKSEDDGSFLTDIVYNKATESIAAGVNHSLYKWKIEQNTREEYHQIVSADITAIAVDSFGRKIFIGTLQGDISVFNYSNGLPLRTCKSHSTEITAIVCNNPDRALISCSLDNLMRIHCEIPTSSRNGELSMGYEMKVVREADLCGSCVTCIDFSHELSLVATGSNNSFLTVWDFTSVNFEGCCTGHAGEITAIQFLSPLPALISADSYGSVLIWAVRPHPEKYQRILFDLTNEIGMKMVTSMFCRTQVEYCPVGQVSDPFESTKLQVVCGDDDGFVSSWDISSLLTTVCKLNAVNPQKYPSNKRGYNPQRLILRQEQPSIKEIPHPQNTNPKRFIERATSEPDLLKMRLTITGKGLCHPQSLKNVLEPQPALIDKWKAHQGQICHLCPLHEERFLSSSYELVTKVWTFSGELLATYSAKAQVKHSQVFLPVSTGAMQALHEKQTNPETPEEDNTQPKKALAHSHSRDNVKQAAKIYSDKRRQKEGKLKLSSQAYKKRNKILSELL